MPACHIIICLEKKKHGFLRHEEEALVFFPEEMKIPGLLSKEADEPCHGVRKNAEANIEKIWRNIEARAA